MRTAAQHDRRYERFRKLLLQMREDANLSQRALGDLLNKPQSWVYNCESGNRRVDLAEFCRWCKACNVDPVDGLLMYLGRSK